MMLLRELSAKTRIAKDFSMPERKRECIIRANDGENWAIFDD